MRRPDIITGMSQSMVLMTSLSSTVAYPHVRNREKRIELPMGRRRGMAVTGCSSSFRDGSWARTLSGAIAARRIKNMET